MQGATIRGWLICAMMAVPAGAALGQSTSRADFEARAQALQSGEVSATSTPSLAGPRAGLGVTEFNCTIRPLRVVEVAAQINGVAETVLVRPGQQVRVGDPLVELDSEMTRADLRLAEARAANTATLEAARIRQAGAAEREARLKTALERRAISPAEYESAALELAMAEADILREEQALDMARLEAGRAQLLVEKARVLAPVDGVVGEDLIDPGESASGRPLATLYVNQPLRVEAFVPAAALAGFVGAGGYAIAVNDDRAAPYPVTFDYAAQLADIASGTISVFFTLEAPDVLPGSKCQISVSRAPGEGTQ